VTRPGRRLASALTGSRGGTENLATLSREDLITACAQQGFTHIEIAPYDLIPAGIGGELTSWIDAKAVLFEHAPLIKKLCGSLYLFARRGGDRIEPTANMAEHACLFDAVSVVVPCHNESANLENLVYRLLSLYGPYIHEIILVNDNSSDDTEAVARRIAATDSRIKLINRSMPNGVGLALKDGYRAATGRYILSMDCDFVEILTEFRGLFDAVAEGYDGAIGSRFSHNSVVINYPFAKMLFNRACHLLIKLLLIRPVRDVTNNLKLYRASIFKELTIESPHFSANLETGLKPVLAGYNLKEVPVSWVNRTPGMGKSSFYLWKVGLDYARTLYRIWKSERSTAPGLSALPKSQSASARSKDLSS
jgi:dolichol-phosphate mannosyltransferase